MSTKPTLQESLEIIRKWCREVLEASERATPGPWLVEEGYHRNPEECGVSIEVVTVPNDKGHTLFDTYNRGYKESGLYRDMESGEWFDTRGEKDLSFVALSRNFSPHTARALLVLCDEETFDCYEICPSHGGGLCQCGAGIKRVALIQMAEGLREGR